MQRKYPTYHSLLKYTPITTYAILWSDLNEINNFLSNFDQTVTVYSPFGEPLFGLYVPNTPKLRLIMPVACYFSLRAKS